MWFDPKLLVGGGLLLIFVLGVVWPSVAQAVMALAAVFTAWIAWIGVSTWWRQVHGQSTYELATDLKATCGRLQDRIDQLRRPQLPHRELQRVELPTYIEEPDEWLEATYEDRMNAVDDEHSELRKLTVRARALWEDEENRIDNRFERLTGAVHLLDTARRRHIRYLRSRLGLGDEQWEKTRRELWGRSTRMVERELWGNGQEDWVAARIDESLGGIEEVADSKLDEMRPSTRFPGLWQSTD